MHLEQSHLSYCWPVCFCVASFLLLHGAHLQPLPFTVPLTGAHSATPPSEPLISPSKQNPTVKPCNPYMMRVFAVYVTVSNPSGYGVSFVSKLSKAMYVTDQDKCTCTQRKYNGQETNINTDGVTQRDDSL